MTKLCIMRTALRRLITLVLAVTLAVALLGLVVLPIAAATLGPSLIRSAGLDSTDLAVHLSAGPAILVGRVDALGVRSGPLTVAGRFSAADARIELRDVSIPDRTFGSLDVAASDLAATLASGEVVHAQSLTASGPASDVVATARFSAADLEALLVYPAVRERLAIEPTGLRLGEGTIILETASGEVVVRLEVDALGDLVLRQTGEPTRILWAAKGNDARDWRLTSVSVDATGATVTAHFDVAAFLARYPSLNDLLNGFIPAP